MKIDFKDGSYIEFIQNSDNLCITMSGKKPDGTLTHSSSFIDKKNSLELVKYILSWLEK